MGFLRLRLTLLFAALEDNENPDGDPRQKKICDSPTPFVGDASFLTFVQNEWRENSPSRKNDL